MRAPFHRPVNEPRDHLEDPVRFPRLTKPGTRRTVRTALAVTAGVLTAYPIDEGCYDFAVRKGLLSSRAFEQNKDNPKFIGSFSSVSLEHFHYEEGKCVSG